MTRPLAFRHGRIALWLAGMTLSAACTDAGSETGTTLPTPTEEMTADPCSFIQCGNGGACRIDGTTPVCDCPSGFTCLLYTSDAADE